MIEYSVDDMCGCFQLHDSYLKVGAAIPLNNLIGLLLSNQEEKSPNSFGHLAAHLKKVSLATLYHE